MRINRGCTSLPVRRIFQFGLFPLKMKGKMPLYGATVDRGIRNGPGNAAEVEADEVEYAGSNALRPTKPPVANA